MVDPILLLVLPLAVAFMLPLIDRLGRPATRTFHLGTVAFVAFGGLSWLYALYNGSVEPVDVVTGGWDAPLGITLRMGVAEAALIGVAAVVAFGSELYLAGRDQTRSMRSHVIQLLLLVGSVGLIATRDLFNVFVFLEVTSIGTYALVALGEEKPALEAGFKYMVLGALASTFVLLGIAFLYKATGTLNIDQMPSLLPSGPLAQAVGVVFAILLVGLVAELKLFPLNGPAVDLYDGADPGVMALLVGTTVNAVLYAAWKILSIFPSESTWMVIVSTIGGVTFVLANLVANRQTRVRRMMGYSSSAQIGLVIFFLPFVRTGDVPMIAVGLLLLNHTLAKAGLLWLAGVHGGEQLSDWRGAFARRPVLRFAFIALLLAITGLPPFLGFYGKWLGLVGLAGTASAWWIGPLLLGSLFEFGYYFRWYRASRPLDAQPVTAEAADGVRWAECLPAAFAGLVSVGLGVWFMEQSAILPVGVWILGAGGIALVALGGSMPPVVTRATAFGVAVVGAALILRDNPLALDTLTGLFTLVVLGGGLIAMLGAIGLGGAATMPGLTLVLLASLMMVIDSGSLLTFFVGWELMTWTTYLIIGQGAKGERAAYVYMLFSGAAGFLVLAGLIVASGAGIHTVDALPQLVGAAGMWTWLLLVGGFLVKMAAFGTHIYAPDAYTEAPDAFTPLLSGVVSKVPVFALAIALASVASPLIGEHVQLTHGLAWVGAITAFSMTLMAALQSDAKRLLAYSSIGQVGYIILGLAIMSPLGWYAALFHTVHHLAFKMLLFLAIAGVIYRTGTRNMHEMGGLISRMPVSFISVMIGIIALSGVPPLAGFTGKWLLYQALTEAGWAPLLGFVMFGSLVAFLYMYRLIHSIFLGQLKTKHREIKEAPLPLLAAQVILMGALMVIAVWPQFVLEPFQGLVEANLGQSLTIVEGADLVTSMGSYSPMHMMMFVGALFMFALMALLVFKPKHTTKVKQHDIAYAGELPPPPEELHFAYDFFRPYERAFSPILRDLPTRVWAQISIGIQAVASTFGRFYTGNAQTYVLYAIIFTAVLVGLV